MNRLKIREARKAANMTQEQLARVIGINRATLSKYESGAIDPPTSQLQMIANALEVEPWELMGFEGYTRDEVENLTKDVFREIGRPINDCATNTCVGEIRVLMRKISEIYGEKIAYLVRIMTLIDDAGTDMVIDYAEGIAKEHFSHID